MARVTSSVQLLGTILLATACCRTSVEPQMPDPTPVELQPAPPSQVSLPLIAPLSPVKDYANQIVPPSVGEEPYNVWINGGADRCKDSGISAGYNVSRGPLAISASGSKLSMGAEVSYWARGKARPNLGLFCGPPVLGSCGTNGEPLRTANVQLSSTVTIADDWTIKSSTVADPVNPKNRCEVTVLKRDVTDSVVGAMQRVLNGFSSKIDEKIQSAVTLRPKAEAAWVDAWKPIKIAEGSWLELRPQAVRPTQLQAMGEQLSLGVFLEAQPRVTLGQEPSSSAPALPNLTTGPVGDTFNIDLPIYVANEEATLQLKKAMGLDHGPAHYPPVGSPSVEVTDVEVFALGSKVVLKATLGGEFRGWVYLEGTPHYDVPSHMLSFPTLEFSVHTKNVLLKVADWILHSSLREDFRSRARVDLTKQVDTGKDALTRALNQRIGNLQLTGTVDRFGFLAVAADPAARGFAAHLMATGKLKGEVRP